LEEAALLVTTNAAFLQAYSINANGSPTFVSDPSCRSWVWNKGEAAIGIDAVHLQESSIGGDKPSMALALSICCRGTNFGKVLRKGGGLISCGMPKVLLLYRTSLPKC